MNQHKPSRGELVSLVAKDPNVVGIAEHIRETDDCSFLPILADALEDAGFFDAPGDFHGDWLEHLREGKHPYCPARSCNIITTLLDTAGRLENDS